MFVYYRGWFKRLRAINAIGFDTPGEAITAVEAELKAEHEPYHKPVLAVIKGGKHGI